MAALKGSISGDSFDLPIPDVLLHPLERLAPSGPWVFPHPDVWRDKVRRPNAVLGALTSFRHPAMKPASQIMAWSIMESSLRCSP